MAGIGQNRVFDRAALEELKTQAVELMACAAEVTEELKEDMKELMAIADEVPPEAMHADLKTSAAALWNSLDSSMYVDMQVAITHSLDKLCAQIPAYDQENARVLNELSAATNSLKSMLEDLESMVGQGSLQLTLEEFQGQLVDYEKKWSTGVLTLAERMELAMTYLKGLVFTSQFSKDPVNLSTGNFYYEKEDLRINGPLPLIFKRSYNALNRSSGIRSSLGPGWSHNYEIFLTFGKEDPELMTLHKADGKEVTFRKEQGDRPLFIYRDIYTGRETIEQIKEIEKTAKKNRDEQNQDKQNQSKINSDEQNQDKQNNDLQNQEKKHSETVSAEQAVFRYQDQQTGICYFNSQGHLTRLQDTDGNSILFTTGKNGKLRKATMEIPEIDDANEKDRDDEDDGNEKTPARPFLFYAYDSNGMLKEVSDHTDRKITFFYLEGLLHEVTDPEGNIIAYRYNNSTQKLRAVKNARGVFSVRNDYDDKNRIIHQRFPDKGEMHYEYQETRNTTILTERNGSTITYIQDDRLRNIKTIYGDSEEKCTYNEQDQVISRTDRNGNETHYAYDENGNPKEVTNALGESIHFTHDTKGNLLTIRKGETKVLRNRYDENGKLIHTQDALGRSRDITYDEKGRPAEIIQPDQSTIKLTHDPFGNILAITNPTGIQINYTYDALNRVKSTTDGEGNTTSFFYDHCDRISKVINPEGKEKTYTYNESSKVTKMTDFDGAAIAVEYNKLGKPESIIDKEGHETKREYDHMWNLNKETSPTGAVTSYHYDPNNRLERLEILPGEEQEAVTVFTYTHDPAGNLIHATGGGKDEILQETTYEYDALNRCSAITDSTGGKTTYQYDSQGNLAVVTDPIGNKRTFFYNAAGELTEETDAIGNTTRYTYHVSGQVETIIHPTGGHTFYTYLPGGQLQQIIYPDGRTLSYAYDRNGNVKTQTDQNGHCLTYTYDSVGRVIKIKGADGQEKQYIYDAHGNFSHGNFSHVNATIVIDELGNTTRYGYSLNGKLTEVIDALGNRTTYRYDGGDHLIHVCREGNGDNNGDIQLTRYERDSLGRLLTAFDALNRPEHYTYDSLGRVIGKTDREGFSTTYTYTPDGKPEKIQYQDGRQVQLSYSPLRQLIEIRDWLGITRIERDSLDRVEKVTDPEGYETLYEWGRFGKKKALTYPDGKQVHYGYDEHIRLQTLTTPEGNKITYHYDQTGRLSQKAFANGIKTTWSYDSMGQLSELTHHDHEGILDRYRYGYDVMGNKISIEKERRGLPEENGIYQYGYDALNQLISVTKDDILTTRYTYDSFYNRIKKEDITTGSITTSIYNALNQLISSQEEGSERSRQLEYSYDLRGNLIKEKENQTLIQGYEYGSANRLEKSWDRDGNAALYTYNGLNQRVSRNQTRYLLDLTHPYNDLLAVKEGEHIQNFYWDGKLAAFTDSHEEGVIHPLLSDELGSIVRAERERGIYESYGYDEFGNDRYGNLGGYQPFGYTGEYKDLSSGTYYLRARYYQPTTGRFLAEDSYKGDLSDPLSLNLYTYCGNNPVMRTDPSGHDWKDNCECLEDNAVQCWNMLKDVAGQTGSFMVDAYLGLGMSISGIISFISDAIVPYRDENLAHNLGFTVNDFIYGQGYGDAAQMKMGYFTGDYNGCGWIATYNATKLLGNYEEPAYIINYYDGQMGTVINGALGITPLAVNFYFSGQGYQTEMTNFPVNIDARIKDQGVGILEFMHDSGAHYVAIQYNGGMYDVYNERSQATSYSSYNSIEGWLKDKNYTAMSLVTMQ